MQTQIRILTGIFIAILFYSCEKTIDFDGGMINPKIVVNGVLTPDNKVMASISKSKSLLMDYDFFESLTNAKADLYVDDVFVETLIYKGEIDTFIKHLEYDVSKEITYTSGIYTGETTVEKGKTYRLEVSCEGFDEVSCETTVPMPVLFSEVDTSSFEEEGDWGAAGLLTVALTFNDPANVENYYRMKIEYFGGNVIANDNGSEPITYSDTILTHTEYSSVETSDPIFKEKDNEANDIVMGAPANQFAIFTDELIKNSEYTLSVHFNYLPSNEYNPPGIFSTKKIVLCSLSKEYFKYLNTSNYHFWFEEDAFSEPVPVYSNVRGGMGIWGSESFSTYEITTGKYPLEGKVYIDQYEYYLTHNVSGGYGSGGYGYTFY